MKAEDFQLFQKNPPLVCCLLLPLFDSLKILSSSSSSLVHVMLSQNCQDESTCSKACSVCIMFFSCSSRLLVFLCHFLFSVLFSVFFLPSVVYFYSSLMLYCDGTSTTLYPTRGILCTFAAFSTTRRRRRMR